MVQTPVRGGGLWEDAKRQGDGKAGAEKAGEQEQAGEVANDAAIA